MFRPTHFVILFAVVLCANAFPAAPDATGPVASETEKSPQIGESQNPSSGSGSQRPDDRVGPAKGDLDTDATTHWGYAYYGPRWAGYYGPGWVGKAYAYGPYGWW